MFLGLSLQLLGLTMASLPTEMRRQHGILLLSAAWIAICLGVIAAFVVVLPDHQPDWVGKDRIIYEYEYAGAVEGYTPDYEIAFSLLTDLIAWMSSSSTVYFLLIFTATMAMMHVLVSYLFRPADWLIVYFFYFNYFAFYNGALNIIRQALGVALCLVATAYFLKDRRRIAGLLIILATLVHSACIFSFVIFVTRIRGASVWRLVAAVFIVFALSRAGVTEAIFDGVLDATGIYPTHLIEYTMGMWSWREYTGGIYRMDFLLFSLLPVLPYAAWHIKGGYARFGHAFAFYERMMKVYVALIIPFSFFSYMMFSDRYALQAWMMLPMALLWPFLYLNDETPSRSGWVCRTVILAFFAVVPNILAYETTLLRICREIL